MGVGEGRENRSKIVSKHFFEVRFEVAQIRKVVQIVKRFGRGQVDVVKIIYVEFHVLGMNLWLDEFVFYGYTVGTRKCRR